MYVAGYQQGWVLVKRKKILGWTRYIHGGMRFEPYGPDEVVKYAKDRGTKFRPWPDAESYNCRFRDN